MPVPPESATHCALDTLRPRGQVQPVGAMPTARHASVATHELSLEAWVAAKNIIVVGGSAGAVEVLKALLQGLPDDLATPMLVVVHLPPSSPGRLPEILQRHTALRVSWATDGEAITPGRIYLAPPDRHLLVEDGRVRLTRAPRENHSRPAIDPLFRSAALVYGPRVVAVVLSGRLDDGTAGLWAVKERGGIAVVQDPEDAAHSDMPRNALEYTDADHVVASAQLGPLLARLTGGPATSSGKPASPHLQLEVQIAMEANALQSGVSSMGSTTPYTCPECHGVLMRVDQGGIPRFRCHTGHAYALDSLLASVGESVEAALWGALRAVEESVLLLREAARHAGGGNAANGDGTTVDPRFEQKAREAQSRAELIRDAVLEHQALSLGAVRAIGRGAEPADVALRSPQ
jgi:two-component system chemotaxis response regulator CheB